MTVPEKAKQITSQDCPGRKEKSFSTGSHGSKVSCAPFLPRVGACVTSLYMATLSWLLGSHCQWSAL